MKRQLAVVSIVVCFFVAHDAWSQSTFTQTTGTFNWNDDSNWSPPPFPNSNTAAAILQAPTGELTVNLGQAITVNALTVDKPTSGNFSTTISGNSLNTLTFAGTSAALVNGSVTTPTNTGATVIAAPLVLGSNLSVTQRDNDSLQFNQQISGAGNLTILRIGTQDGNGDGVVTLGTANTYTGTTSLGTGGPGATNFLTVRLNDANSIPGGIDATGGTNLLTISQSTIVGLAAGDFRRGIGTGTNQVTFSSVASSGFAAIGGNRVVNFGGNDVTPNQITWNATFIGQNNAFVLGSSLADGMADVKNPINLLTGVARTIRTVEGSAAIDGRISGVISGSAGSGNLTKTGSGTLSLAAANTYSGTTVVDGGVLRLDNPLALNPAAVGPLNLQGGGVLCLGVDTTPGDATNDFARNVGAGANQIQFLTGTGSNASNAGFAAAGGNRVVVLNGDPNSVLTWNVDFVKTGGNFVLSDEAVDSTIEFKNRINLNGEERTFAARDGAATLDGRLTGIISGTGATSSFKKTQPGSLELAAANTYEGNTTIGAGVLLLTNATSIPGGTTGGNTGNIIFNGNNSRLGLGADNFTSGLGAGPGQVQFQSIGDGGFAAFGADRVVNLGGASAPIVWGTGDFAPATFILGAAGADKTVDFQNPIDLGGAARTVATRDGSATIDGIISGVISGTGGLTKGSAGGMAFTAANTYDGGTILSAGTLFVNNITGSGVGVGDVTVNTTATLGGSGFVGTSGDSSNVTVITGGHIAPGSSAGNLTVTGIVTFATGSFFDVELGGLTAGTEYDKLTVDGAAALSGTLNTTLINAFTPVAGNSFTILSATGGVTGTFENVVLPTVSGIGWQLSINTNDVVLTAISAGVAGDYNGNGVVDGADYVVWRKNKGLTGSPTAAQGNGDGDNDVDDDDYAFWRTRFGNTSGSGSSLGNDQAVPEPATLISLVTAALTLVHGRRRKVRAR